MEIPTQRTVQWLLAFHFGYRARYESRKLRWGDTQLQQDKDGQEMLVWLNEGRRLAMARKKVIEGLSNLKFMPLRPKDVQ